MKSITTSMSQYLSSATTAFATCWLLTLTNGTQLSFTDWTDNITFDAVTYQAMSGYTRSAISGKADLSVANLEVIGLLDSGQLVEADIEAGLYDFAAFKIFQVVPADLTAGSIPLRSGTLGQITIVQGQYTVECRGLAQLLDQSMLELYQIDCRADFGDSRCTKPLDAYTYQGTVGSVVTAGRTFAISTFGQSISFTGSVSSGTNIVMSNSFTFDPALVGLAVTDSLGYIPANTSVTGTPGFAIAMNQVASATITSDTFSDITSGATFTGNTQEGSSLITSISSTSNISVSDSISDSGGAFNYNGGLTLTTNYTATVTAAEDLFNDETQSGLFTGDIQAGSTIITNVGNFSGMNGVDVSDVINDGNGVSGMFGTVLSIGSGSATVAAISGSAEIMVSHNATNSSSSDVITLTGGGLPPNSFKDSGDIGLTNGDQPLLYTSSATPSSGYYSISITANQATYLFNAAQADWFVKIQFTLGTSPAYTFNRSYSVPTKAPYAVTFNVGVVINNGVLTWLTGANAGLKMEVKTYDGNNITLYLPANFIIEPGDTFSVTAGCDRTYETCLAIYNNILNFRGFPTIPGLDTLLYPNAALQYGYLSN